MSQAKTKVRGKAGTSKAAAEVRRRAFAVAYTSNGRNGTQAAITAGFPPKGAAVAASRMLKEPKIISHIEELTARAETITGLDADRTLREVARVAYSDPRKLYASDGTPRPITELDDDCAAVVAGVEVLEEFEGRGEDRKLIGYTKKLKLWDKNAALEKAMKFHGLYEKDNSQRGESLAIKIELV